jgi:hypothetical protein
MHNHFLSELERKTLAEDGFEDPQRRKGAEMSRFCIFYHFSSNIQQMSNPKNSKGTIVSPYMAAKPQTLNQKGEKKSQRAEGTQHNHLRKERKYHQNTH